MNRIVLKFLVPFTGTFDLCLLAYDLKLTSLILLCFSLSLSHVISRLQNLTLLPSCTFVSSGEFTQKMWLWSAITSMTYSVEKVLAQVLIFLFKLSIFAQQSESLVWICFRFSRIQFYHAL